MSVTTNNYTAAGNGKLLAITNELNSVNVLSAVSTALTGLGWTAYDTVSTTWFNPIVTQVFRVLNYDGVTYKYLIIRWDTIQLKFYTSTCESWNTGTHLPTNESWSCAGGFAQGYDLINSFIIVSASARHAMLWSFINNQPGMWSAVVEFERVAQEDIAAISGTPYPCYAWTNSVMLGTPYGQNIANAATNTGQSPIMFAFPRLPDGTVGPQAANNMAPVVNKSGQMPPNLMGTPVAVTGDNLFLHLGAYYRNINYRWDLTGLKSALSPISVDGITKAMGFGRAYNFGVLRPVGTSGDTIYANVDPTGGWPSSNTSTSTNTECFLLPLNGGTEANAQAFSPHYGAGLYNYIPINVNTASVTNSVPGKVIAIGDNVWFAANDGIRTASISGGVGTVSLNRLFSANGITDISYDGQRTVYGATSNGIAKIDTINYAAAYATSAQTIANGCGYLGQDQNNIYASSRFANVSPSCIVLDKNAFTITTGNTYVHKGTVLATASSYATPVPDYQGNVYLVTTPGTSVATQSYIASFIANTGVGSTAVNPNLGSILNYGGNGMYYDYLSNRLWLFSADPTNNRHIQQELYPANLQIVSTASLTGLASGLGQSVTNFSNQLNLWGNSTQDYRGDLSIIPFRGMHFISPKQPGNGATGVATPGYFTVLIHPSVAITSNTYPAGNLITINNTTLTTGLPSSPFQRSGGLWTDGCRLFASHFNVTVANQVYIINGIYQTYSTAGLATSRLMLRG